jgi:hypothetical protein
MSNRDVPISGDRPTELAVPVFEEDFRGGYGRDYRAAQGKGCFVYVRPGSTVRLKSHVFKQVVQIASQGKKTGAAKKSRTGLLDLLSGLLSSKRKPLAGSEPSPDEGKPYQATPWEASLSIVGQKLRIQVSPNEDGPVLCVPVSGIHIDRLPTFYVRTPGWLFMPVGRVTKFEEDDCIQILLDQGVDIIGSEDPE